MTPDDRTTSDALRLTPEEITSMYAALDDYEIEYPRDLIRAAVTEIERCWALLYPHERAYGRQYRPCLHCGVPLSETTGYCAARVARHQQAREGSA